jgi:hypothetical protein
MSKHFLRAMVLLPCFLLLGMSVGARAQDGIVNARGNWTIYSRNIDNGAMVTKHVQIHQGGNEIWGHFEGPNQSGPIHGFVNGHHIEFDTQTRTVLHFRGQINEDGMSGMYGIRGQHAEWSAVRE